MATNNNNTAFKYDKLVIEEVVYIGIIRQWLQYAKENKVCYRPTNSKRNLDCMLKDFFIEPKFALFKSRAVYITLTGVLKKPFIDWKIADEEWFTKLDTYYKKLLIDTKLKQLEGDFTND